MLDKTYVIICTNTIGTQILYCNMHFPRLNVITLHKNLSIKMPYLSLCSLIGIFRLGFLFIYLLICIKWISKSNFLSETSHDNITQTKAVVKSILVSEYESIILASL